jgi:predicted Rossmann-fold nucleotide-binding protein
MHGREIRTKRVIAVFGGSGKPPPEVLDCAEKLGSAITARGHLLLTGGTGPGEDSVKAVAITGAGPAPWAGVAQGGPIGASEEHGGLVIRTGLGDKRNYLEACICDAAVALPGSDGTVSEVTSSLSLSRPVAFVGNQWREKFDLDADRPAALQNMVQATRMRFARAPANDTIDPLVAEDALMRALDHLPDYRYFELGEAEPVVQWIESVVPAPVPFAGEFRPVPGLEGVARDYERWLRHHDL